MYFSKKSAGIVLGLLTLTGLTVVAYKRRKARTQGNKSKPKSKFMEPTQDDKELRRKEFKAFFRTISKPSREKFVHNYLIIKREMRSKLSHELYKEEINGFAAALFHQFDAKIDMASVNHKGVGRMSQDLMDEVSKIVSKPSKRYLAACEGMAKILVEGWKAPAGTAAPVTPVASNTFTHQPFKDLREVKEPTQAAAGMH